MPRICSIATATRSILAFRISLVRRRRRPIPKRREERERVSDIDEDSVRSCLACGCEEAQFVAFIETDHCTNVFLADKLRRRAESRKRSRRSCRLTSATCFRSGRAPRMTRSSMRSYHRRLGPSRTTFHKSEG